jgi:protein TonB
MWPAWFADMDPANRARSLGITASLILHAFLLAVHFKMPDGKLFRHKDSQLEVMLVNAKSARKPDDPHAQAQANLDGGGNTDENRIAKTPLPPTAHTQTGNDLVQAQRRQREVEVPRQALLTRPGSERTVQPEPQKTVQPDEPVQVSGRDLAESAVAMTHMEAAISRSIDEYNRRPRKKFVGARTVGTVTAQYIEDWRHKVERVGNVNYPEAAKGRIYGSLVLTVSIRSNGEVDDIEIYRSSGHKILDDAARRILKLAAPFGPFSPELKREADILVITRTWSFTSGDRLQSE